MPRPVLILSALVLSSLGLTARTVPAPTDTASPSQDSWRETALAGLEWVRAQGVDAGEGALLFPDVPGEDGTPTENPDLYHGQAGRVLGFLQAFAATGDEGWRRTAEQALAGLVRLQAAALQTGRLDAGLYSGLAGTGGAYLVAGQILGDPDWTSRAVAVGDSLVAWSHRAGVGLDWNGVSDIIGGSAGTGLFLLRLHEVTGQARFLRAAESTAVHLATVARPDPDGPGRWWPMAEGADLHYPNFAHGTSGVAFFLRRVAGHTTDPLLRTQLLEATAAGMRWLEAHGEAGACVVYHHEPGGEDLQYAGWCHGPVGTGRLFLLASSDGLALPPDLGSAAWVGTEWLLGLGPEPGESPSGYWGNVSVCCGTAGMLAWLLDLHLATGEVAWLEQARTYARVLTGWAVRDGAGARWPQAEHRVRPELVQAQTGWMQGAAGISAMLLRLHLVEQGRAADIVRLPDELWLP